MLKMGFDSRWVEMVMRCVTTISYKVAINGCRTSSFTPGKIRRPLEPLFILNL